MEAESIVKIITETGIQTGILILAVIAVVKLVQYIIKKGEVEASQNREVFKEAIRVITEQHKDDMDRIVSTLERMDSRLDAIEKGKAA